MYNLSDFMSPIITIGGLGFINFFIITRLGELDKDTLSDNEFTAITLGLAVPDYLIYLTSYSLLKKYSSLRAEWLNISVIFVTVVLTVLLTFALSHFLSKLLLKAINTTRKISGKSEIIVNSPWGELVNPERPTQAFIYGMDHKPLGCGEISVMSDSKDDNYSILLKPLSDKNQEEQYSFERIMEFTQDPSFQKENDVKIYENFKQAFIIVTIS